MEIQGRYLKREFGDRSGILTTWMMSYEQVASESEETANLLKLWAFLDHQDLWHGLIASVRDTDDDVKVPKWLAALARNELEFDSAILLLRRYSLIDAGGQQRQSHAIHAVLHAWCFYLSAGDEHRRMLLLAARVIAQAVPTESLTSYWTQQRRLLPHGLHAYTKLSAPRGQQDWTTTHENDLPAWVSHELGRLFAAQVKLAEAEAMYKRALVGREKVLEAEHRSALRTINNLGLLYSAQGKLTEAEVMYERALVGKERALGLEHTSTLRTVNHLGLLYTDQGRLAEAETMFERALAGREKVLGMGHTSTLGTINNLGVLYSHQGKLAEAEVVYKRSLEGYQKALGAEHSSTLRIVNNLGNLYFKQGKLAEAEVMYEQALAGYEKAIGVYHTSTLDIVNNLGILYSEQGKLTEAETLFERALAGYEKALGPEHTSTICTVDNIGLLYTKQGKLAEAEVMYERALSGRRKAFGAEHMDTLITVNNLGNLYIDQDRLAEAEAMHKQALAGYEKVLGQEHIDTLRTVDTLSRLFRKRHYLRTLSINRNRVRHLGFVPKKDTSLKFIVSATHLWIKWTQARTVVLEHIGHMLLSLGYLDDAVEAFERLIVRGHEGSFHRGVVCDGCDDSFRLPSIRYVCMSCDDVDLCATCHQVYELDGRLGGRSSTCQDHTFLAVPRGIWWTLLSGAVSADGTTDEEWMTRLLYSLTKSNDATLCKGSIRAVEI
jgi:tetratricopeptide (TPR) repeat protein